MEVKVRTSSDLSPGWYSYCDILMDVVLRFLLIVFGFFNTREQNQKKGHLLITTDYLITEVTSGKISLLKMFPTGLQILGN